MFVIIVVVIFVTFYLLERVIRSLKVSGFAQKYVFITGCDSGFGQKLAIRLDSLGFPVFAGCLTDDGQNFLSENGSSRLTTLSLDITETESIQKALDLVKQKLPSDTGLWAIVNNAGITGPVVPSEMCPMDGYRKALAVNVLGAIEICQKFLPLVRKMKGRVVNIASMMGRNACANSAYNVSKFAMEGFSDSLRREVFDQGIKVSILEPGYFKTNIINKEMVLKSTTHHFSQVDEEVQNAYGKNFVPQISKMMDEIDQRANPNLNVVVDAYTHAIVSKYPQTRYVLGWDAHLFFIPLTFLPAGVADWVLNKIQKRIFDAVKNE